jgi:hypothetical protein
MKEVPPKEQVQDNTNSWINVQWSMDVEELKELMVDVMPARRMLVKVSGSLLVHVLAHIGPCGQPHGQGLSMLHTCTS